jgi:PKD repeat protein
MKKIKLIYILLIAIFAGFTSCKNDDVNVDPAPLATAQFTQNVQITERYEVVRFTNTSVNATRYEWDFGKGITSTIENPEINFYDPGTYTVQLKAYNSSNKPSVAYGTVKVGRKHITKIEIERLDSISGYGYPWDPQDGPDLYVRIAPSDTPNWIYSPVHYNVSKAAFPVSWEFSPNVVIGPAETWTFQLYDEDLPFPAESIMGPRIQTHSSTYTTKTDSGTKGYFVYEQREARMKIYFDVK